MNFAEKIYDSIRLNLGIKAYLKKINIVDKNLRKFDNNIMFPIYEFFEHYFYKKIIYRFGAEYRWGDEKAQNISTKKYSYGYGYLHYALIRNQKPSRILCVGSMYGFIPFMMAKACRDNKKGHVDFVDADYNINNDKGNNYYGQGFWGKNDPNQHFDYMGVNKYISTHIVTTKDFAKSNNYKYDYIYLDGDHSYKGAALDLKLFWPRLNKEGFLCFHDIHFDKVLRGMLFDFGKIWKDISKMPFKFEVSNHYSGLGFVQKLTDDNLLKMIKTK